MKIFSWFFKQPDATQLSQKIAEKQHIPFKLVLENEALRTFICKNHLHHKITKQHQTKGLCIKVKNGQAYFPVAYRLNPETHKAQTKWVALKALDTSKRMEFLANGLEAHDSKKWQTLRPLYRLSVENGMYVHIDTLTGQKQVIGKERKNYVQLITVNPWGWSPKGGALFGHTWIRFIVDGQLYHVGADLSGNIVNPDFMASVPMAGKNYRTSPWSEIDDSKKNDLGHKASKRIFKKLEALQHYLLNKEVPKDCPYTKDVLSLYKRMRKSHGGTCTSAAAMMYSELTGVCYLEKSRPLAARIVFNAATRSLLDIFWKYMPQPILTYIVQPIQTLTRGSKPTELAASL